MKKHKMKEIDGMQCVFLRVGNMNQDTLAIVVIISLWTLFGVGAYYVHKCKKRN